MTVLSPGTRSLVACRVPMWLSRSLRALSTTASTTAAFPHWLHLKAYAPYQQRMQTTDKIANSVTKSGGYLIRSILLSDMATTMVLEDMDPKNLGNFTKTIKEIDGLVLSPKSKEQLEHCLLMVEQASHENEKKARHIHNFEQSLHDLEEDGLVDNEGDKEWLHKCHKRTNQLHAEHASFLESSSRTVNAILQLTWKNEPSHMTQPEPHVHEESHVPKELF